MSAPPSTLRLWLRLTPLHLFAVVAVVACVAGGLWQFSSYESRQGDAAREARSEQPVPIGDVWAPGRPFRADLQDRSVQVSGRFAPTADQLWVVGQTTQGRAWLVAPFLVDGSDAALLVVRGSADAPGGLAPVPDGPVDLQVVLRPSEGGATPLDADRVTSAVTVPSLINQLPYRLWSGYGLADADVAGVVPSGLTPVEPPDPDVSWTVGLKNLAYALQWWVFALFAVFMWWRMSVETVAARRAAALAPADEPDLDTEHLDSGHLDTGDVDRGDAS